MVDAERTVTGMADLYVTKTEMYSVHQSVSGGMFADYIEGKLREDGLTVIRTESTTGITVSGTEVIRLGGDGDD